MVYSKHTLHKVFQIYNILSLDVVIGSLISSSFFVKIFYLNIEFIPLFLLAISIWCVYTVDHLIDAQKSLTIIKYARYNFHHKHSKKLIILVFLSIASALIVLPFLRTDSLIYGAMTFSLVVFYFVLSKVNIPIFIPLKQPMAAMTYCFGILTDPLGRLNQPIDTIDCLVIFSFFLIVFFNVLLFSYFDRHIDKEYQFQSIIIKVTEQAISFYGLIYIFIAFSLNFYLLIVGMIVVSFVLNAMLFVLVILFIFKNNQFVKMYHRLIGDGVFFIPLIYLVLF